MSNRATILALVLVAGALLGMGRGLAYLVDEGLGKRDPVLLDRAVMATVLIAISCFWQLSSRKHGE